MVTIENSRLFSQLSPADLEVLRSLVRERTYEAGQEIFREGAEGDGIYLVKEGTVEISAQVARGPRRVFSRIAAGEIFGEMAVLDAEPRSASATALELSTVYFLPREDFLGLMDRSPGMARGALREISRRLRDFDRRYLREVFQAEGLAAIGRFAAWVVHDLKNPVHSIGLLAETICLPTATPESRQRGKEVIRQQIANLKELVDEILAISEESPPEILLTPSPYGEFLRELYQELQGLPALKSCRLQWQEPAPPVLVRVNPHRLRRVFLNLLQNAAAATPEGGAISVTFRADDREVVTEIRDTGPGVALEMADQLFTAFATHGKFQGIGLGLFICKRIMDEHKGWIAACNQPEGGAVFSFGIPLARPPGTATPPPAA